MHWSGHCVQQLRAGGEHIKEILRTNMDVEGWYTYDLGNHNYDYKTNTMDEMTHARTSQNGPRHMEKNHSFNGSIYSTIP